MNSILLVDDERWVRTALRKTIEKTELPFQVVHEAANGLEALDWLKHNRVDLVLTDVRMPVMDGLAMMRQLLLEERHTADVIVVSGHDDFNYAQQALRLGAIDYLLKPVETEEMHRCLSGWLQRRDSRRGKAGTSIDSEAEDEYSSWEMLSPVEQVIRLVHEALPGEITLKEAAERVHLNACYLSQLFKQKTGKNFVEYVTILRMQEAEKLLSRTSLRIYEIAERLGFCDISHFSNMFKKYSGYTPSEFRKRQMAASRM